MTIAASPTAPERVDEARPRPHRTRAHPDETQPRVDEARLEELLRRLHAGDPAGAAHRRLRDEAITLALPLATRIAARYRRTGEPAEALRQVAAVALINAVDGYRPGAGPCFLAYAVPTILGALRRHFRDHTWSVRVPRRLQELRLRIVAGEQALAQRLGRVPTPADLAADLGVPLADVREALEAARAYRAVSLEAPAAAGGTVGDRVGAPDDALVAGENALMLRQALAQLPDRVRRILVLRFGAELTQSEIAEVVGVSQMHVSRLLRQALETLRRQFDDEAAEPPAGHRTEGLPAAAGQQDPETPVRPCGNVRPRRRPTAVRTARRYRRAVARRRSAADRRTAAGVRTGAGRFRPFRAPDVPGRGPPDRRAPAATRQPCAASDKDRSPGESLRKMNQFGGIGYAAIVPW